MVFMAKHNGLISKLIDPRQVLRMLEFPPNPSENCCSDDDKQSDDSDDGVRAGVKQLSHNLRA
jgi:hypothetical protein